MLCFSLLLTLCEAIHFISFTYIVRILYLVCFVCLPYTVALNFFCLKKCVQLVRSVIVCRCVCVCAVCVCAGVCVQYVCVQLCVCVCVCSMSVCVQVCVFIKHCFIVTLMVDGCVSIVTRLCPLIL